MLSKPFFYALRSSVACSEPAREALKTGGISAAVAKRLVDDLGYSEPQDLVHITQVGITRMHAWVGPCWGQVHAACQNEHH